VPIQNLFDLLAHGRSVDDFLAGFPTVAREQVLAVLDLAAHRLAQDAVSAA
jgi:uncharacterized protein (DUF433 family)